MWFSRYSSSCKGVVGSFLVGVYSVVDAVIRLLSIVCYEGGEVCVAGSF